MLALSFGSFSPGLVVLIVSGRGSTSRQKCVVEHNCFLYGGQAKEREREGAAVPQLPSRSVPSGQKTSLVKVPPLPDCATLGIKPSFVGFWVAFHVHTPATIWAKIEHLSTHSSVCSLFTFPTSLSLGFWMEWRGGKEGNYSLD